MKRHSELTNFTPDGCEMVSDLYDLLNKTRKHVFLFYSNGAFCFVISSLEELDRLSAHFGWLIIETCVHSDNASFAGYGYYRQGSVSGSLWHGYAKAEARDERVTLSLRYPDDLPVKDSFIPSSSGFQECVIVNKHRCHYLFDYYPTNQFPSSQLDIQQRLERNAVFRYKDGSQRNEIARTLGYAINKEYADKDNMVVMTIPASTIEDTQKRCEEFCALLSWYTNIPSAYEGISLKYDIARANHFSQKDTNHIMFHPDYFRGKHILLIDDLLVSGKMFSLVSDELVKKGAYNVHGIFVAKSVKK